MNEWQMQPLRIHPSEGLKLPCVVFLFYLATLPGAGVRGRTRKGRTEGMAALGSGGGR